MNDKILLYLKEINPNPKCELVYNKDYEFLISVMLSARATDKRVNMVTKELFSKYKSLNELKNANIEDIKNIIKSLGNYTKKSKAIIEIAKVLDSLDNFPTDRKVLERLPMIGRKTVSVVQGELFGIPNIGVDTHVERVSKRLNLARENLDVLGVERALKRKFPKEEWINLHLRLVNFGRYYCTAKNPKCDTCKLKDICKYYKKNNKGD